MNNNINILCIIPARSGSKGIPNKNIIDFKGKPMIAWSILQAQKCKYKMKIIVSTDSSEYAKIANQYGAETPFLRPSEISGDLSTDYECINHCIDWLNDNQNYNPDIILHLRPTQPCRKVKDINKCVELFIQHRDKYDSLRTVIPIDKSPYKMYLIDDNQLNPLFVNYKNINEPYNQCRQILPVCYLHNGYIDILNSNIVSRGTISGNSIYPYVMNKNDNIDIDYIDDILNII